MKKNFFILIGLILFSLGISAQKLAMDFNRNNCSGTNNHLYEDLDSGKAVVLFYYMPSCGSCPPPAVKVQKMLNNLNKRFPNMVKGYAMPFNNTSKCVDVNNWVSANGLTMFTPMDSGATQVAYYGGMGMPSVVLVGGKDHRVLFEVNQDRRFTTSDTTLMKDSILALFGIKTGLVNTLDEIGKVSVFPNPSSEKISIGLKIEKSEILSIRILDIMGRQAKHLMTERVIAGNFEKEFNVATLPSGNYLIKIEIGGNQKTIKLQL